MSLRPQFVQTLWAQSLVQSLKESGIDLLVISPGSRSTPIALAAIQGDIPIETVIDERSAAFFALGYVNKLIQTIAILMPDT